MAAGGLRGTEAGNFHTRSAIILRLKAQVTAYRTMPFRSAPERPLSEGRREWAMHPASRRTRSCHAVADMVPSNLPPEVRDDIVQFIFMALLEGSLRRDEVKARSRRAIPNGWWLPNLPDAACKGRDDLPWIPDVGGDQTAIRRMRRICAGCPELERCREVAVATPELLGVWGGLTTRERAALRGEARR